MSWQSQSFDSNASKFLRAKLETIVVVNPEDARFSVRISDISSLTASASISIRKGGTVKVPMFDVSFTAYWEGNSILGATRTSKGTISVNDILPEDVYKVIIKQQNETPESSSLSERELQWLDFKVTVLQDATTRSLEVDKASLETANTLLVTSIKNAVRSLSQNLFRIADGGIKPESLLDQANEIKSQYKKDLPKNEEKLKTQAQLALSMRAAALEAETKKSIAKAKADRAEEEKKKVAEAIEESSISTSTVQRSGGGGGKGGGGEGGINQLINKSHQDSLARKSDLPLSPLDAEAAEAAAYELATKRDTIEHIVSLEGKAEPAGAAPEVVASKWNVNQWGWEEKEFTPWARKRLNELLAGVDVDVPSGHIRIVEVETVRGDATVSLRKGKSFVTFELEIEAHWEGTLMDDDGRKLGSGDGDLVVSQLDHETGPAGKFVIGARPSSDGTKIDKRLAELTAKWGALIVKKRVSQFVKELMEKGEAGS
jgi:activator of HSP90 ATPase